MYRICRRDFEDIKDKVQKRGPYWEDDLQREDCFLRKVVINAIGYGSTFRSPFLHACISHKKALAWHRKAAEGGYKNNIGYMVRINVAMIGIENCIDLSNLHSQKAFFDKGHTGYGDYVAENFHWLTRSMMDGEVCIMWRGKIPLDAFEVLDAQIGEYSCSFKSVLPIELGGSWCRRPPAPRRAPPIPPAKAPAAEVMPQPTVVPTPPRTVKAPPRIIFELKAQGKFPPRWEDMGKPFWGTSMSFPQLAWEETPVSKSRGMCAQQPPLPPPPPPPPPPVASGASRDIFSDGFVADYDVEGEATHEERNDAAEEHGPGGDRPEEREDHKQLAPIQEGPEEEHDDVEEGPGGDRPVPEYHQLLKNIREVQEQKRQAIKHRVSGRLWELIQKVWKLEKNYIAFLNHIGEQQRLEFTKIGWQSEQPEKTTFRARGNSMECFMARSQDEKTIARTAPFANAEHQRRDLLISHGNDLMEVCGGYPHDDVPLAPFSIQALANKQGSQPSRYPDEVSYALLLAHYKYIDWTPGGRKPGKVCNEHALPHDLEDLDATGDVDYGLWWLNLGGFDDPSQLDANGFSALHHACDASSYSWRAAKAAVELIPRTPPDIINIATTVKKEGWPGGYTVLHLAAAGSDRYRRRRRIVELLIQAKADINVKTLNDKANTAANLASSQGACDVALLLLGAGADKNATNSLGLGMLEASYRCSSTGFYALQDAKVPNTHSKSSGRTRQSSSAPSRQQRMARRYSGTQEHDGSQPSQRAASSSLYSRA